MGTDAPSVNDGISVGGQAISRNDAPGWPLTFQLINRFYEHRSLIITTNKDFTSWGEFFHDDNVAVPIVDRIIHHSHLYLLGGESYRLKQKTLS